MKMARLENAAQPPLVKLLLLGDAGAGKTCLRLRFAKGAFLPAEDSTAASCDAAAFSVAHLDVEGGGVAVQVWDCGAGDPDLGLSFDGVVAVFDVTNSATLASAAARSNLSCGGRGRRIPRILVGTKCDRGDRTVTPAEGKGVAQRHDMLYFEASASTGAGVREAFDAIVCLANRAARMDKLLDALGDAELHDMTMLHVTSGFGARATASTSCCLV